jgi:hypothetical protein
MILELKTRSFLMSHRVHEIAPNKKIFYTLQYCIPPKHIPDHNLNIH